MPDPDKLTRADPSDLANALAYALRFHGRKRIHNADEIMAEIVARRLVEHLERSGFIVMKRPAEVGAAPLGRGSKVEVERRRPEPSGSNPGRRSSRASHDNPRASHDNP